MFLALGVVRCICCCSVRRVSWGLCVGVLGNFLWVGVWLVCVCGLGIPLVGWVVCVCGLGIPQIMPNLQITYSIFTTPNTTGSDHLYNTLELLMMGTVLPETC